MPKFKSEPELIGWNEQMAHKYDPEAYHLRSHFLIRWIERQRVKTILAFLEVKEQDRALEVGCGAGNILEQMAPAQLHGVDLSAYLLKKSQHRLQQFQAELSQANAQRLPLADRQFDKIVCSEVLEHVVNPEQVIKEMARVAKTEGVIVISVPNEEWINRMKRLAHRLGLTRWLLKGDQDAYHSPDKMTDEWHLHNFDSDLLAKVSSSHLRLHQLKAVPFKLVPLRYVGYFKKIEAGIENE